MCPKTSQKSKTGLATAAVFGPKTAAEGPEDETSRFLI